MEATQEFGREKSRTAKCPECGAGQRILIQIGDNEWAPAWSGGPHCLYCGHDYGRREK